MRHYACNVNIENVFLLIIDIDKINSYLFHQDLTSVGKNSEPHKWSKTDAWPDSY